VLVLGVDPATHIGLALASSENEEDRGKAIELDQTGFQRLQSIATEVERTIKVWEPDFAVIEGYAFCRNIDSFIRIVEVGTAIKQVLFNLKIPWVEVPPTTLKKWVTGKGHAKKEQMAESAKERWLFVSKNSDIIDAYGLAKMGLEFGLAGLQEFTTPKAKKKRNIKK
jgi:crossover junction endodeoxyribonuclease RuvC